MQESDFASLGEFAPAGLEATRLALQRAERSSSQGRIPIAGAAVSLGENGELTTVTVGCNGRIPAPDSDDIGYPTDHGETAAIRKIDDVGAWDWSRIVFATTLSPCIMCSRTLAFLHSLGLTKIVIAESQTFAGAKHQLGRLAGMTLVELSDRDAVRMMQSFARTYPWDWAADIGQVPPEGIGLDELLAHPPQRMLGPAADAIGGSHCGAAVMDAGGRILAAAGDGRADLRGNPCRSAVMLALGKAGPAANLRECGLAFAAPDARRPAGIFEFGLASLGACELFRPAWIVTNCELEPQLHGALQVTGVKLQEGVR